MKEKEFCYTIDKDNPLKCNEFVFRWIPIEEAPPPIGLEVLLELKYIGSQFARFYSVGMNQGNGIEHQFIASDEKHFEDYKVVRWKLIN